MADEFTLAPLNLQKLQAKRSLLACNEFTQQFGLNLTEDQAARLVDRRFNALRQTGRVEFGEGILHQLVYEFCDSPFLHPQNYEETIAELQDAFYYFKGEAKEQIPDDELLALMKQYFDTVCQGSLEYLIGTSLEDICRNTRYGNAADDKDRYGRPF